MRIIVILLSTLYFPYLFGLDFPNGWRLPTKEELSDEPLRNQSPTKNAKVEGDFNGDGTIDYAFLLKSTTFSGEALAVRLSTAAGYSWHVVNEINWGNKYPNKPGHGNRLGSTRKVQNGVRQRILEVREW